MRGELTKIEVPTAKSRWRVRENGSPAYVMAVADGYVMARHPGCYPFVTPVSDWHKRYEPAPPAGRSALSKAMEGGGDGE